MTYDFLNLDQQSFVDYVVIEPLAVHAHLHQMAGKIHKLVVTCLPSGTVYTVGVLDHVDLETSFLNIALDSDLPATSLDDMSRAEHLQCVLVPSSGARTFFLAYRLDFVSSKEDTFPSCMLLPIPNKIFYVQRRELFRVTALSSDPMFCSFDQHQYHVPVLDISLGGIALEADESLKELYQIGDKVYMSDIFCGDLGKLSDVNLEISNISAIYDKTIEDDGVDASSVKVFRMGMRFLHLDQRQVSLLQRYIAQLERKHYALSNGKED